MSKSFKDCLDELKWSYTETDDEFRDLVCDCGGIIESCEILLERFFRCPLCGKGIHQGLGWVKK